MTFLRFLADLRTPAGDAFFSAVTHMGEETIFIVLGIVIFWCLDKKRGMTLLIIGFAGTVLNQFLKLLFRVPRPWVLDPEFKIVESARAEASGYSFPSGHTQQAVGIYGYLARICRPLPLRAVCLALCVLVPFSRMYLGVHTPKDVLVSAAIAILLIWLVPAVIERALDKRHGMTILFAVLTAICAAVLAFLCFYPFPADIDYHNYHGGIENVTKLLFCTLGIWAGCEIDRRYIRFETRAVWQAQLLKLVPGLAIAFAIKAVLKAPLIALIGNEALAGGVRYFLLALFCAGVWPATFKHFDRLFRKA